MALNSRKSKPAVKVQSAAIPVTNLNSVSVTPRLLTIKAAAAYLSATVWAVRTLLWQQEIRHTQIGRRILIDRADLDAFVNQRLAAGGGQ